jgi:cation transporter-like permease
VVAEPPCVVRPLTSQTKGNDNTMIVAYATATSHVQLFEKININQANAQTMQIAIDKQPPDVSLFVIGLPSFLQNGGG